MAHDQFLLQMQNFLGATPNLPLFKTTTARTSRSTLARYVIEILNDPDTRNVFFFLLLNITFTIVEFLYGIL
jgi:hypothetical protein